MQQRVVRAIEGRREFSYAWNSMAQVALLPTAEAKALSLRYRSVRVWVQPGAAGAQNRIRSVRADLSRPSLRIQGMETWHWIALAVVALLWLVSFPASAVGGYDIAHIVKRTCEPGGSLIVEDKWKRPQDRDRVVTEPGEVIACPPAGPRNSFQIAAGPERFGGEAVLCTYFSLLGGDGADLCFDTESADGAGSLVKPLMTIRADQSDRLELVGIVSDDVATVAVAPAAGISGELTLIPIERQRAARLGATRAFAYFSLAVDRRTVCAYEAPRVLGLDSSGQRIAESAVPTTTALLSAADHVPYARSLDGALCGVRVPDEPAALAWLAEACAMLRLLLRSLI
jgi:hypothetical protein